MKPIIRENCIDSDDFKTIQYFFNTSVGSYNWDPKTYPGLPNRPLAWYWHLGLTSEEDRICDPIYDQHFVHVFFMEGYGMHTSEENWLLLKPIFNSLDIYAFLRVKANCHAPAPTNIKTGFHEDTQVESLTCVYYLDTNNGGTELETGEFIKSEANKCVIFPSVIKHTSVLHTDTARRTVLNINFIPHRQSPLHKYMCDYYKKSWTNFNNNELSYSTDSDW